MKKSKGTSQSIDGDLYINPKTGSTLNSDLGNRKKAISIPVKTHHVHSSRKYAKIDIDSLDMILGMVQNEKLRSVDMYYFLELIAMMDLQCMLVTKKGFVHDQSSLCKELNMNERTFRRSFDSLMRNNLIAKSTTKHPLLKKRIICINPYIIRKVNDVDLFVNDLFKDPREKGHYTGKQSVSLNHIRGDFY